jgi:hypothetical protein
MNARPRGAQIPVGPLVAAIGAVLLIVSLFLDWYEGLSGFTVFEFLDLLLVALAFATIARLASDLGVLRAPSRPGLALVLAVVALLIVLSQIVNDPPAVAGPDGNDQDTGIWLALVGAILMVAGAVLSTARIAIAVEPRGRAAAAPSAPSTATAPPPASAPPASEDPTIRSEPPTTSL